MVLINDWIKTYFKIIIISIDALTYPPANFDVKTSTKLVSIFDDIFELVLFLGVFLLSFFSIESV